MKDDAQFHGQKVRVVFYCSFFSTFVCIIKGEEINFFCKVTCHF